jgi:hypothetical protein
MVELRANRSYYVLPRYELVALVYILQRAIQLTHQAQTWLALVPHKRNKLAIKLTQTAVVIGAVMLPCRSMRV